MKDPTEIAYYDCFGPRRSTLLDLAWIEECFQQAKNEAGLDHYQMRSWRAWYAHITLSMLAHGLARGRQIRCRKGGIGVSEQDMIDLTLPEIRRLLIKLFLRITGTAEHVWSWSCWCRRHQHQARLSHYKRRGYLLT
ncbi:hypothetical protein GCM10011609_87450 [Lentzea pudingi]|uniref:Uncharacterized protein n=1 Tax=Lentzea pudingi TaxID=1789439 RepID=A0ABQ2IUF8_9PSEU|nr:hypothetical protein GCM10011609_87450 [Lentzea pudingi]